MYEPDRIDWQIIKLLIQDGRLSNAEISRNLNDVSARTVTNKIDALIKQGIINIRGIVNPENIGYEVLTDVFIEVEPGALRPIANQLADYPQISYLALATGDTDIIISVRSRSIDELFDFVVEEIGKIPGVRHTRTYPLPLSIKDITTWLPPEVINHADKDQS